MTTPTGGIRVSPSGLGLSGNVGDVLVCLGGNVWHAAPGGSSGASPAPANPGDNGAVATASGGLLSYLKGSVTGQALLWTGTAWAAALIANVNLSATAAIATSKLGQSGASLNDVLTWNGSAWAPLPATGGVSSFNTRTGAVVPATNDYTIGQLAQSGAASGQYPSWNGAAWVPTTPLTSPANPGDNGKVAVALNGDFSYAFLVNANVAAAAAIAVSKLAPGTAGQALITTGGVPVWGSDFGATELLTTGSFRVNDAVTGFLQIGTNTAGTARAATAGNFRIAHGAVSTGFTFQGRNSADSANRVLWQYGVAADTFALMPASGTLALGSNGTAVSLNAGGSFALTVNAGAAAYTWNNTVGALWSPSLGIRGVTSFFIDILTSAATTGVSGGRLSISGQSISGANAANFGGPVALLPGTGASGQNGNVELFGTSGVAKDNGMGFGVYMGPASSAPTAGPATGMFHWAAAGGLPTWCTATNNFFQLTAIGSATASAGGGAAVPLTVLGFVGCQVMVAGVLTAGKLAVFAP